MHFHLTSIILSDTPGSCCHTIGVALQAACSSSWSQVESQLLMGSRSRFSKADCMALIAGNDGDDASSSIFIDRLRESDVPGISACFPGKRVS
jgi:hypothetical protein